MNRRYFRIILFSFFLFQGCAHLSDGRIETTGENFPANGVSGGQVIYYEPFFSINEPTISIKGPSKALQILEHRSLFYKEIIYFQSTMNPGQILFQVGTMHSAVINFYPDYSDTDLDGFPDVSELLTEEDRTAFRNWFIRIVEAQYMNSSASWNRGERDCAGLIRFAYREALKRHDGKWQDRSGIGLDKNLPDIRRFHYPEIPVLGQKIFRTTPVTGTDLQFKRNEQTVSLPPDVQSESEMQKILVNRNFSEFVVARGLMKLNTQHIGSDFREALPGDLLFFLDDRHLNSPFHSMIITGTDIHSEQWVVIYHTGGNEGMKRVVLDSLLKSRDNRWHPEKTNPHFLGIFRFHILM